MTYVILRRQKLTYTKRLAAKANALLDNETDFCANIANVAALLFHALPNVNWVGFYFLRDGDLVLGPFQGKPACTRIAMGKGVCGTAAARRETIVVPDVHKFPGHIACDEASNAEIVIPVIYETRLVGVLDLDSPNPGRFDELDRQGLEEIVAILVERSQFDDA